MSFHAFFFSSRRRHTRCLSDWSSDVCSSDLGGYDGVVAGNAITRAGCWSHARRKVVDAEKTRSEERRVGKECRARWAPDSYKKYKTTSESTKTEEGTKTKQLGEQLYHKIIGN